eukprot:365451-Chlamydomonas_euryale.AAC.9
MAAGPTTCAAELASVKQSGTVTCKLVSSRANFKVRESQPESELQGAQPDRRDQAAGWALSRGGNKVYKAIATITHMHTYMRMLKCTATGELHCVRAWKIRRRAARSQVAHRSRVNHMITHDGVGLVWGGSGPHARTGGPFLRKRPDALITGIPFVGLLPDSDPDPDSDPHPDSDPDPDPDPDPDSDPDPD